VLGLDAGHVKAAYARAACKNLKGDFAHAIEDYSEALEKDQLQSLGRRRMKTLSGGKHEASAPGHGTDREPGSSAGKPDFPSGCLPCSAAEGVGGQAASSQTQGLRSAPRNENPQEVAGRDGSMPGMRHQPPLCRGAAGAMAAAAVSPTPDRSPPPGRPGGASHGSPAGPATSRFTVPRSAHPVGGADSPKGCGDPALATRRTGSGLSPGSGGRPGSAPQGRPGSAQLPGSQHGKADWHHARGYSLRKQGNFRAAVEEYTKAIDADPWHFKALFNRGFSYDKLGEHAQAVQDYTRALRVDPTNSYALYNRGITLDQLGDYAAATADFTAAIEQDPTNADFYHNRGFSLRKQGQGRQPAWSQAASPGGSCSSRGSLRRRLQTTPEPLRSSRATAVPTTTGLLAMTTWGTTRRQSRTTHAPCSSSQTTRQLITTVGASMTASVTTRPPSPTSAMRSSLTAGCRFHTMPAGSCLSGAVASKRP